MLVHPTPQENTQLMQTESGQFQIYHDLEYIPSLAMRSAPAPSSHSANVCGSASPPTPPIVAVTSAFLTGLFPCVTCDRVARWL